MMRLVILMQFLCCLMKLLLFDHFKNQIILFSNVHLEEEIDLISAYEQAHLCIDKMGEDLHTDIDYQTPESLDRSQLESNFTKKEFIDAINNSIKLGYKLIEIDLIETSDNKLVGAHDWDHFRKISEFFRAIVKCKNLNLVSLTISLRFLSFGAPSEISISSNFFSPKILLAASSKYARLSIFFSLFIITI